MRRRELLTAAGGSWLSVVGWHELAVADDLGFRVIVHPSNALGAAPDTWLADAFLKKVSRWSDGELIRSVDQRASSAARRAFSERVLRRSVGAVRSYWQQRIFSGRELPPPELDSDESVIGFVAKYPGAIGYVSSRAKLASVRELLVW